MAPKSTKAAEALKKELAIRRFWKGQELVAVDKLGQGGEAHVYLARVKTAGSNLPTFAYREELLSGNGTVTAEARRKVLNNLSIHGQLRESRFILPLLAYAFEVRDGKLYMVSIMPTAKGTLQSAGIVGKDGLTKDYKPWMKLWELQFALGVKDFHRLGFSHNDLTAGYLFVVEEEMSGKKVLNLAIGDFGKASKEATAAEKESDVRLLYKAHVRMLRGAAVLEALSGGGSGSVSDKKEEEIDTNEQPMLNTINDLGVAAEMVPLFPYFQGKQSAKQHPQWSLDLDQLPAPYKGHPFCRRPKMPLLEILHAGDGRLRLRQAYAHSEDEVPVKADVAGYLQPYLWPSGFTCAEAGSEQCRPRVLYDKRHFEEHRHPDSKLKAGETVKVKVTGDQRQKDVYAAVAATKGTNRPNMVYATKILMCEEAAHKKNGAKCWMDVALHNEQATFHVFKYFDGGKKKDNWKPCKEVLHLGQLVEGSRAAFNEPWIDLFTHAAGKRDLAKDPLARHLAHYGIPWTAATDEAINAALDAAIQKALKAQPSGSKTKPSSAGPSHRK